VNIQRLIDFQSIKGIVLICLFTLT